MVCGHAAAATLSLTSPQNYKPQIHYPEMMEELSKIIVHAIWFIWPAYIPNSIAVLVGGGTPMDFGRKLKDGRRILGDGKTWRGFVWAVLFGIFVVGGVQNYVGLMLKDYSLGYIIPFAETWPEALGIIFLLSFGAMVGDAFGSFLKRRIDIPRGEKAFLFDQMMFVFIAWLFLGVFATGWLFDYYLHPAAVVSVVIMTLILHKLLNIAGYKLGKKKVPW